MEETIEMLTKIEEEVEEEIKEEAVETGIGYSLDTEEE